MRIEDGNLIASAADTLGCLSRLLPGLDDTSFCLLRFIDPYGNTVFNRLQMDEFLEEWGRMTATAESDSQLAVLNRIEWLAKQCQESLHEYLKFEGD